MNLREAILNRRSIRVYNDQEIKREDIIEILNDAVYAPTHKLRQTWRFILIEKEAKEKLINDLDTIFEDVSSEEAKLDYRKRVLKSSPAVLVVVNEKSEEDPIYTLEEYGATSALIQNFQLLAYEKGMGVCWKSRLFNEKLAKHIGVKEHEMIAGALTLGYYDEAPVAKKRTEANDKLSILV